MKATPNQFDPDEIIFSVTDNCNLHCGHCFVKRNGKNLDAKKACDFIQRCIEQGGADKNWKVGFTGGEPFLNLDFLCKVSKFCVEKNIEFDRIMTNGIWWKTESELKEKLTRLYQSGYDGKFGLSFDSFHGGDFRYAAVFCRAVNEIWQNPGMLEIQSTYSNDRKGMHTEKKQRTILSLLAMELGGNFRMKNGTGWIESDAIHIRVDFNAQSVMNAPPLDKEGSAGGMENDAQAAAIFHDRKWFKDDFCQGMGQLLFVHSDGNVAPCCGFANENPALFIGTIDDSYETLMENALKNPMVKLCFTEGLLSEAHRAEKSGKLHGKCSDQCQFCAWVCENQK